MNDAAKPDDPTAPPGAAEPVTGPTRRPYSKPALIDHGSVSELTRGGVGTTLDGRGGSAKKLIRP